MTSNPSDKHVVLIVDDIPDNLAMLSDALGEAGYVVLVATDGLCALERLDYATPDLILLDAMMPGLDGFETCRRIRQHRSAAHVPVIFMTGLTETEHVVRGFEVGGTDYVVKPIQPQQVIARIAAHLRNAGIMSLARSASDAAAHAVIVLDAAGRPVWQTAKGLRWIERYFPQQGEASQLPRALHEWVQRHLDRVGKPGVDIAPLTISIGEHALQVQFSTGQRSGDLMLVLTEHEASAPAVNYQLTPREEEVLAWLAKGKTNRDIADILGMSPRTVNKHLEHIYIKLGVETRSAAAVVGLGVARSTHV